MLGGSGPRTKHTANGMPQIRPIGVVGVLGQNAPLSDGLRGMIEGRLGRRTGVKTALRWTQVPPSRNWWAFRPEAVDSTSQFRPGCWSIYSC